MARTKGPHKVKFQVYVSGYTKAYVGLYALKYGFWTTEGIKWGPAFAHLIENQILKLHDRTLTEKEGWLAEFKHAYKQLTGREYDPLV